jgi:hypothetical protein
MLWARVELEAGAITPREAERIISQATRMLAKQGVQPQVAVCHLGLAEISFHIGDHRKTISSLRRARTMFNQMGMTYWMEKADKLATVARL